MHLDYYMPTAFTDHSFNYPNNRHPSLQPPVHALSCFMALIDVHLDLFVLKSHISLFGSLLSDIPSFVDYGADLLDEMSDSRIAEISLPLTEEGFRRLEACVRSEESLGATQPLESLGLTLRTAWLKDVTVEEDLGIDGIRAMLDAPLQLSDEFALLSADSLFLVPPFLNHGLYVPTARLSFCWQDQQFRVTLLRLGNTHFFLDSGLKFDLYDEKGTVQSTETESETDMTPMPTLLLTAHQMQADNLSMALCFPSASSSAPQLLASEATQTHLMRQPTIGNSESKKDPYIRLSFGDVLSSIRLAKLSQQFRLFTDSKLVSLLVRRLLGDAANIAKRLQTCYLIVGRFVTMAGLDLKVPDKSLMEEITKLTEGLCTTERKYSNSKWVLGDGSKHEQWILRAVTTLTKEFCISASSSEAKERKKSELLAKVGQAIEMLIGVYQANGNDEELIKQLKLFGKEEDNLFSLKGSDKSDKESDKSDEKSGKLDEPLLKQILSISERRRLFLNEDKAGLLRELGTKTLSNKYSLKLLEASDNVNPFRYACRVRSDEKDETFFKRLASIPSHRVCFGLFEHELKTANWFYCDFVFPSTFDAGDVFLDGIELRYIESSADTKTYKPNEPIPTNNFSPYMHLNGNMQKFGLGSIAKDKVLPFNTGQSLSEYNNEYKCIITNNRFQLEEWTRRLVNSKSVDTVVKVDNTAYYINCSAGDFARSLPPDSPYEPSIPVAFRKRGDEKITKLKANFTLTAATLQTLRGFVQDYWAREQRACQPSSAPLQKSTHPASFPHFVYGAFTFKLCNHLGSLLCRLLKTQGLAQSEFQIDPNCKCSINQRLLLLDFLQYLAQVGYGTEKEEILFFRLSQAFYSNLTSGPNDTVICLHGVCLVQLEPMPLLDAIRRIRWNSMKESFFNIAIAALLKWLTCKQTQQYPRPTIDTKEEASLGKEEQNTMRHKGVRLVNVFFRYINRQKNCLLELEAWNDWQRYKYPGKEGGFWTKRKATTNLSGLAGEQAEKKRKTD